MWIDVDNEEVCKFYNLYLLNIYLFLCKNVKQSFPLVPKPKDL